MATKIIAEAGVNHNGSLDMALKLVEAAKRAGADAIKFQTFKASSLAEVSAPLAQYQKINNSYKDQTEMLRSLELSNHETIQIYDACEANKIEFMSSAFGIAELNFLLDLGITSIKIPSGEITNIFLLEEISIACSKKDIKVLMSTGMCNITDIEKALSILTKHIDRKKIEILHCVSSYPAPNEELNLNAMKTIKDCFHCKVGYSDHSENIIAPVIAVALGATIIEKHLTLDRELKGPDHKASITPDLFQEMVKNIRQCEEILGNGIKIIQNSEYETKRVARRSIRASKNIKTGDFISRDDLILKRPGDGINPMSMEKVVGSKASKDYKTGDLISDINLYEI